MVNFIRILINRFRVLSRTRLEGSVAIFVFHHRVRFILEKDSEIVIRGGGLRLGYPLEKAVPYASYGDSVIQLGRGARLICDGTVAIAPGATIRVSDGGTLHFHGDNVVAHNVTILCSREITIGRGTHISWNVTMIDDDGHHPWDSKGKQRKRIYRPLQIGSRVGIQMNVLIPQGVTIGDLVAVSAGTVVRQNIPSHCIAYSDFKLKIQEGLMPAPPQEIPT